jgi:hypothetical protein
VQKSCVTMNGCRKVQKKSLSIIHELKISFWKEEKKSFVMKHELWRALMKYTVEEALLIN